MLANLKLEHWLSLVLGFTLGVAIGLFITWQVWPVEYYNTDPVDLRAEHKDDYVVMIAAAYAQDDNLELAASKLDALGLEDAKQVVLSLFQTHSQAGHTEDSRSLALLAYHLGVEDVALLPYVQTPTPTVVPTSEPMVTPTSTEPVPEDTPTPTEPPPTVTPTQAPPTATPTPTLTPPAATGEVGFHLVEQLDLGCGTDWGDNYILVYVQDENGRGLSGVQILVSGPGGEDYFFTGLKPEVDAGFADFLVAAPGTYRVEVVDGASHVAEGITFADGCPAETPYHAWRVTFRRASE